jgi:hypothetical protein
MRHRPDFRPTHFTALFDATRVSVALQRYAVLTGAFERARQEDKLDRHEESLRNGYRAVPLSRIHEQARVWREQWLAYEKALRARVERLGGTVSYFMDETFIEGISAEQYEGITEDLRGLFGESFSPVRHVR